MREAYVFYFGEYLLTSSSGGGELVGDGVRKDSFCLEGDHHATISSSRLVSDQYAVVEDIFHWYRRWPSSNDGRITEGQNSCFLLFFCTMHAQKT